MTNESLHYTGKDQAKLSEPYLPSRELVEAVNVTMKLKRPLLIKGEPGCGKTRLAKAVAEELGLPYREWPVKSVSTAREGLYKYDTIRRLRDAQLAGLKLLDEAQRQAFDEPETYVTWGPLGEAFRCKEEKRYVVLIDEIDKADIDFPNDLLHELDKHSFEVAEARLPPVQAGEDLVPIIFITSNDEKELPNAFLRRCLFFHIKFPDELTLRQIVSHHTARKEEEREDVDYQEFVREIVDRFMVLRQLMAKDKPYGGKNVSTSELIDWVKILKTTYFDAARPLPPVSKELLFPSVLLKTIPDYVNYSGRG